MSVDTSNLKTLEDARDAIEKIDWKNDTASDDAHMIAEWIWKNCDHDDKEVVREAYIWADEDSELESLAAKEYYE